MKRGKDTPFIDALIGAHFGKFILLFCFGVVFLLSRGCSFVDKHITKGQCQEWQKVSVLPVRTSEHYCYVKLKSLEVKISSPEDLLLAIQLSKQQEYLK